MSFSRNKRDALVLSYSEEQESWGDLTLSVLNLSSRRSRRRLTLNAPPPPPPRQPDLVDKINTELMTFDQLQERIGHAPHGDRLGGAWKMSAHYKEMRTQLGNITRETNKPLEQLDEATLRQALDDLEKAGNDYARKHRKDPNRAGAGNDIAEGVRARRAQLEAVCNDPDFDKVKDHITIEQALDCKARGIRFCDCDFDTLSDSNIDTTDDDFGSGNANSVAKLTYNDGSFRIFKAESTRDDHPLDGQTEIGIDPNSPHNGNRNIASTAINDLLGVSVIAKSSFGLHQNPNTNKMEIGLMMEEAQGKSPGQIAYTTCMDPGGGIGEWMEKVRTDHPDKDEALKELKRVKIRPNPDFIEGVTDEALRWQRGKVELQPPWDPPLSDDAKASLQEQLSGLDWCDALTGQTDRHSFNYFVKIDGDNVTVCGIDNDMAFGKNQVNAKVTRDEVDSRRTPPGLPQLIDRKVYDEIVAKTFERDLLPKLKGLLTEEEIDATRQRFEQVQEHANSLAEDFIVDDWNAWRHPDDNDITAAKFLANNNETAKNDKKSTISGGLFGRDFAGLFEQEGML